jgi:hypothetical protein
MPGSAATELNRQIECSSDSITMAQTTLSNLAHSRSMLSPDAVSRNWGSPPQPQRAWSLSFSDEVHQEPEKQRPPGHQAVYSKIPGDSHSELAVPRIEPPG